MELCCELSVVLNKHAKKEQLDTLITTVAFLLHFFQHFLLHFFFLYEKSFINKV